MAFISFPTCSNQASDPDGDGYGWENNTSCKVDQAQPAVTPVDSSNPDIAESVTVAGVIYRLCSAAAVDDNGDGFAWENNGTCLIPANIPMLQQLSEFPVCSISIIDHNQDGYGWENNASCRFSN